MKCSNCGNWTTERKTVYEDGTQIVAYVAPLGRGQCEVLKIDTDTEFGCTSFKPGVHVVITRKSGAPWQHFKMIPCPSCSGNPGGGHCQCAGTGLTRLYDDGYVGDERTRRHPKEPVDTPTIDPGTVLAPIKKADTVSSGPFDVGMMGNICSLCECSTYGISWCANEGCPSGFKSYEKPSIYPSIITTAQRG